MATAKVECTCEKCGRKFEHRQIKGNRQEANNYEAWALEHITICPDCYREGRKAEEAQKIANASTDLDLPELVGSEKQIAWAVKIRNDLLDEAKLYRHTVPKVRKIIADGKESDFLNVIAQNKEKYPREMKLAMAVYKAITETSAKWWIENR